MHQEQYIRSIEDTFASGILTVRSKVQDYAKDEDAFSNFRFAAQAAGVTVEQVFLVLLGVKLARLQNLLTSGKAPLNEAVEDTLIDSINYTAILKAYRELKNSTDPTYAYAGAPEIEDESSSDFYDVPDVDEEPEFVTPAPPEESQTVYEFTKDPPSPTPAERILDFFGFRSE